MAEKQHIEFEGLKDNQNINPNQVIRDDRSFEKKLNDWLSTLEGLILFNLICAACYLTVILFPFILMLQLLINASFYKKALRTQVLPYRLPYGAKGYDYNMRKPGGIGYDEPKGDIYLGNEIETGEEVWNNINDWLVHFFVFGSTGAGKTVTLQALMASYMIRAFGAASASFFDAKGTSKLALENWVIVRRLMRDDDFLLLNFSVGQTKPRRGQPGMSSHSTNILGVGTADFMGEAITSLIPESEGENAVFSEKAVALAKTLLLCLEELRDKGYINLSVPVLRSYMTLDDCIALAKDDRISENARESMRVFLASVGADLESNKRQGEEVYRQFSFAQGYFIRVFNSLTDTYRHIYGRVIGHIDMRDVLFNGRFMTAILPAMEKAPPEIRALGKLALTMNKMAIASAMGSKFEGTYETMIENLPSGACIPSLIIEDEIAFMLVKGHSIMQAQARSIGVAFALGGQSYAGIEKVDAAEAEDMMANTNIVAFMKQRDPQKTFELVNKLAGMGRVSVTEGKEVKYTPTITNMVDSMRVRYETIDRINFRDLLRQNEGEAHLLYQDKIVRMRMYYPDINIRSTTMFIPRLITYDPPTVHDLALKYGKIAKLKDTMVRDFADRKRRKRARSNYAKEIKTINVERNGLLSSCTVFRQAMASGCTMSTNESMLAALLLAGNRNYVFDEVRSKKRWIRSIRDRRSVAHDGHDDLNDLSDAKIIEVREEIEAKAASENRDNEAGLLKTSKKMTTRTPDGAGASPVSDSAVSTAVSTKGADSSDASGSGSVKHKGRDDHDDSPPETKDEPMRRAAVDASDTSDTRRADTRKASSPVRPYSVGMVERASMRTANNDSLHAKAKGLSSGKMIRDAVRSSVSSGQKTLGNAAVEATMKDIDDDVVAYPPEQAKTVLSKNNRVKNEVLSSLRTLRQKKYVQKSGGQGEDA